ncbi:cupin domain-containing protein [Candidimonas nitroreducens]|uniref:Cupin n=1 Tax=Candidimonas nitroreducens TaxID=683354 RepID=A0A225MTY3_9BURK|nr:cupin domain-containing protein [Candidimonas nitroreducens]OWT63923.1 cupin [Candidimonas nitroreducens]
MEKEKSSRVLKESDFHPEQTQHQLSGWPKQAFHVSHLREEDFTSEGFRSYTLTRDLGFAKATGGMVQAHVNRRARPYNAADVSHPHFHDTQFQMVYVLKGWVKSEFEGHGVMEMRQGSCWLQPPMIKHNVLDYSDDLEILEIIIPARYDTVNVEGSIPQPESASAS